MNKVEFIKLLENIVDNAKIGILVASLFAGVAGYIALRLCTSSQEKNSWKNILIMKR